jgi:Gpi18-like mannosyltransferase
MCFREALMTTVPAPGSPSGRPIPRAELARALAILLAAGLLQVAVAALPDTMGDLQQYRTWVRALVNDGLATAYWPPPLADPTAIRPPLDYPPLFPYVLWVLGHGLAALAPAWLDSDRLLDFAVRLPLVLSNLLLAALVYVEARRIVPARAVLALALVALNPALIFDTAYWGQADALLTLLVVLAFVSLARGRPERAWVTMALAVLVKPLAAPLAPLVALETLRRFGPARVFRCAGVAAVAVLAVFLPFAWIGRLGDIVREVVLQVDVMPFVSVNAHNLWWLVGGGVPWVSAQVRPLGLLSFKMLSLALFGAFYAVTLVRLWRSSEERASSVAAAGTALGFFVLVTHMHENHLFAAVPLLALASFEARRLRGFYLVASVTLLANMVLHDPYLTHVVRPHVPGPHLLLPQELGLPPLLGAYLVEHGYPWVVEQMSGATSLLGVVATLLNAQTNVLLLAAWLFVVHAGRGFDAALRGGRPLPPLRLSVPLALAFVTATGLPFLSREIRYPREHPFLAGLEAAEVRAPGAGDVALRSIEIDGDRRPALFVHPPAEVRYRIVPPPRAVLRFGIALDPETWSEEKGDGVAFQVRVEADGGTRVLFSRFIDPKRKAEDRRWHDEAVDLSGWSGRPIVLVFSTTGGPEGNQEYDWAVFGEPTLRER